MYIYHMIHYIKLSLEQYLQSWTYTIEHSCTTLEGRNLLLTVQRFCVSNSSQQNACQGQKEAVHENAYSCAWAKLYGTKNHQSRVRGQIVMQRLLFSLPTFCSVRAYPELSLSSGSPTNTPNNLLYHHTHVIFKTKVENASCQFFRNKHAKVVFS